MVCTRTTGHFHTEPCLGDFHHHMLYSFTHYSIFCLLYENPHTVNSISLVQSITCLFVWKPVVHTVHIMLIPTTIMKILYKTPSQRNNYVVLQHFAAIFSCGYHILISFTSTNVIPYRCVIRRISLIGAYSLLSAYFAAVLNIPALKKVLFIRRISRISAYFFPVEV